MSEHASKVAITPSLVFLDDEEMVRAVLGRSKFQIRRWEDEGLTVHVIAFPQGRRKKPMNRRFVIVSEYVNFLLARSRTNHEIEAESEATNAESNS